MMKFASAIVAFALCPLSLTHSQEPARSAAEIVSSVKNAADALIQSLAVDQKEKLLFDFNDIEQRQRWSNLPVGIVPRRGVRWGDMDQKQKAAVMGLLKVTLSPMGVQQVVDNMKGDEFLRVGDSSRDGGSGGRGPQRGGPAFGEDEYFISILGIPSTTEPWMWQFGGHHLGINATIVGERITLAPSLTGGQPMNFEFEGRKVRQLAGEIEKMFELIGSLEPDQRRVAVLGNGLSNLVFGPGRDGSQPRREGINAAKLNEHQRQLLLALISERIGLLNDVHAATAMQEITENLNDTWFSWYGPTQSGNAASFRIQAPTLLMEYAPQRMSSGESEHTHAMYRDPTNDYGARFVQEQENAQTQSAND